MKRASCGARRILRVRSRFVFSVPAIWTEDGWIVENQGVPPDHDVEQWPTEVNAGRDPQLEKAIQVVLEALERNLPAAPKRPPFPVRNPPPQK